MVVILLIGLLLVGGAAIYLNGRIGQVNGPSLAGPDPAKLPPVGEIWFGRSFDPTTFELGSRVSAVGVTQGFSFVGHLPRPVDGSALVIRVSLNGQLVGSSASGATGTGDVWGFSPGPLFSPGQWRYDLTDIGGNVLASGTVTAEQ